MKLKKEVIIILVLIIVCVYQYFHISSLSKFYKLQREGYILSLESCKAVKFELLDQLEYARFSYYCSIFDRCETVLSL